MSLHISVYVNSNTNVILTFDSFRKNTPVIIRKFSADGLTLIQSHETRDLYFYKGSSLDPQYIDTESLGGRIYSKLTSPMDKIISIIKIDDGYLLEIFDEHSLIRKNDIKISESDRVLIDGLPE